MDSLDSASERQRSNVVTPTPISRETGATEEVSGGNNLVTARSLNACSYLATSLPLHPLGIQSYRGGSSPSTIGHS